jgi:hypothetical protein
MEIIKGDRIHCHLVTYRVISAVSQFQFESGVADGVRIIPAEQLRVITEIVALCSCKELQQRAVVFKSSVATLCTAIMVSIRLYMSRIVGATLIRA